MPSMTLPAFRDSLGGEAPPADAPPGAPGAVARGQGRLAGRACAGAGRGRCRGRLGPRLSAPGRGRSRQCRLLVPPRGAAGGRRAAARGMVGDRERAAPRLSPAPAAARNFFEPSARAAGGGRPLTRIRASVASAAPGPAEPAAAMRGCHVAQSCEPAAGDLPARARARRRAGRLAGGALQLPRVVRRWRRIPAALAARRRPAWEVVREQ